MEAQPDNSQWLDKFIRSRASPQLAAILNQPDTFRYQLIYTKIDRDKNNQPTFKNFSLNVDAGRYFNPASTVKMPVALVAMEKLETLKGKGVGLQTSMLTDSAHEGQVQVWTDSSASTGLPSIGNYIRKIFIVSDNEAYNRLYEFVGQEPLNQRLHEMGYTDVRITRRFTRMTEEGNRLTNPMRFVDQQGTVIYSQPAARSNFAFDFSRQQLLGQAHYDRDGNLLQQPMDFTRHNNISLADLQQMLQSVLFPASVPEKQRFRISEPNRQWLLRAMSELPYESRSPRFDTSEFFPSYTKFFFFRDGKQPVPAQLRSFNKAGWSYGFLTDIAYVIDTAAGIEFMLSASIYVNKDGILNDDKYEYEETGYAFFREIGEMIYRYELERRRKYRPDLSPFILTYD
ncbi:MAG: hypothetical protein EOO05_00940 [Chitinophagaceae bacterium]|nr:MAG: hypothetical protein EOO05_00940 [Chitinophagaceae bacterium]